MQLNINDIIKIAESVYIDYNLTIKDNDNCKEIEKKFNDILNMISIIKNIDTSNLEPMNHPSNSSLILIKDKSKVTKISKKSFYRYKNGYFLVPKFLNN